MAGKALPTVAALIVATVAWWASLSTAADALSPSRHELADALQRAQGWRWRQRTAIADAAERASNPEWDFMARTFLVLALANDALAEPSRTAANVELIDRIVDDTVRAEQHFGQTHFLLPYARAKQFSDRSGRSVFVDGELALMLAARLLVAPDEALAQRLRARSRSVAEQMRRSPLLSAESYPNEAWTFCNTTALVALRAADKVLGTDHRDLVAAWLDVARERLIDRDTGLLVSSFTMDGNVLDGPEGSSLWMTAHNLLVLDPAFAYQQYERAKASLVRGFAGFAWAAEWPRRTSFPRGVDVDSGPVVPALDASPGSSGLLILAAAAFGDTPLVAALQRATMLGAFPTATHGGTEFAAAGVIGNAVMLYALRFGPLWRAIREDEA